MNLSVWMIDLHYLIATEAQSDLYFIFHNCHRYSNKYDSEYV